MDNVAVFVALTLLKLHKTKLGIYYVYNKTITQYMATTRAFGYFHLSNDNNLHSVF